MVVTTVNGFCGKYVTIRTINRHTTFPNELVCVYVSEVMAQGVLVIHGSQNNISTFIPWSDVAGITYVHPVEATDNIPLSVPASALLVENNTGCDL